MHSATPHDLLDTPWKVLISDDEPEVHAVTLFSLGDYHYLDRKLQFLNAYSGEQTKAMLEQHKDIAVVLLDVVMEEEDSGLKVVQYVRHVLKNHFVRIILRTGQPGIAPEEEAIMRYDINDYKDKTELTDKKLFVSITTALRSYNDIMTIEYLRQNLELKVQERTRELEDLNTNLQVRVAQELDRAYRQEQLLIQQSKMASMGEMIGMIAHQWKQPLSAISLSASVLHQNFEMGDVNMQDVEDATNRILRQVNFMSETIDVFRNFFKPSKKKEVFDLQESLQHVLVILSAMLERNEVSVETHFVGCDSKDNFFIYGYPSEFKHVLLNLLSNAKDALLEKISADSKFKPKITVIFETRNDEVALRIRDNGTGIPPEVLPRIFDNYFSTKGEGGTGIGLYMSKNIIETNMHGTLEAANTGEGAEFVIRLKRES